MKAVAEEYPLAVVLPLPITDENRHYADWIDVINHALPELNDAISRYQQANDPEQSLKILSDIEGMRVRIDDELPDSVVSGLAEYRSLFQDHLYMALLQEKEKRSVEKKPSGEHLLDLTYVLNHMTSAQAARLLHVLLYLGDVHKENNHKAALDLQAEISSLFDATEADDELFQLWLSHHRITLLSCVNSYNFLIEHNKTHERCVLQVEDFLDGTKAVVRDLRRRLLANTQVANFLVDVLAERRASCSLHNDGTYTTRSLILRDYCDGTHIDKLSQADLSESARIELAVNTGIALVTLVLQTKAMRVMNTDYKPSNLFFLKKKQAINDDSLDIMVADCKAYYAIDDEGYLQIPWDRRVAVTTKEYAAPEIRGIDLTGLKIAADPVHMHSVAKHLYWVLMAHYPDKIKQLKRNIGFAQDMFEYPIFQSTKGRVLKALIQRCGLLTAAKRMHPEDAMLMLKQLKFGRSYLQILKDFQPYQWQKILPQHWMDAYISRFYHLLKQCGEDPIQVEALYQERRRILQILEQLTYLRSKQFGIEDAGMNRFTQNTLNDLFTVFDIESIEACVRTALTIQESDMVRYVHHVIFQLRQKTYLNYFSQALRENKADILEKSMSQLSLLERADIFTDDGDKPSKQQIKQALAIKPLAQAIFFSMFDSPEEPSLDYQGALKIHESETDVPSEGTDAVLPNRR